jgi:hypothetical protein
VCKIVQPDKDRRQLHGCDDTCRRKFEITEQEKQGERCGARFEGKIPDETATPRHPREVKFLARTPRRQHEPKQHRDRRK